MGVAALSRPLVLFLIAALSGTALAGETLDPNRRRSDRQPSPSVSSLSRGADGLDEPDRKSLDLVAERFLSLFPSERASAGPNPLREYVAPETHPVALESIAIHLALREAGKHWRRLAGRLLRDGYRADPSYSPHSLGLDLERMRKGWRLRKLERPLRLGLEGDSPARPTPRYAECNIVKNRFFTLDQDLRLQIDLQEMVGIVIGEGPEDDYSFEAAHRDASDPVQARRPSSLPRVQIRGRPRLHIDREAAMDFGGWDRLLDRYGAEITVDLLSREKREKILSASFTASWNQDSEMELVLGVTRRF